MLHFNAQPGLYKYEPTEGDNARSRQFAEQGIKQLVGDMDEPEIDEDFLKRLDEDGSNT